jgi:proteic killer suppression protein
VIRTFRDKDTEKVFRRQFSKKFQAIADIAKRKLDHLSAATSLQDLAAIPGNQLEALKRDRVGQHSIRINDQFRICFLWKDGDAYAAEITDYH